MLLKSEGHDAVLQNVPVLDLFIQTAFWSQLLEALLRRLPVDHIPDGLEILSLAVLVLETKNC